MGGTAEARRKGTTEGGPSRGPSLSSFLQPGSRAWRRPSRNPAVGSRSWTTSPSVFSPDRTGVGAWCSTALEPAVRRNCAEPVVVEGRTRLAGRNGRVLRVWKPPATLRGSRAPSGGPAKRVLARQRSEGRSTESVSF